MDVGADGLAEIHRALGADDQHADGLPVLSLQQRVGRVGSHCHRVLVEGIQRTRIDQEIRDHLLRVHVPGLCQFFLVQDEGTAVDVDLFNADAAHNTPYGA